MRIISWNMNGLFSSRDKRAQAWAWLDGQDPDAALLQEVVRGDLDLNRSAWGSALFRTKYQNFGCAVLVRQGGYRLWEPTENEPWLRCVSRAVCVAQPDGEAGPWLASVHSDAASLEEMDRKHPGTYPPLDELPSRESVLRCNDSEMWEIEPIATELAGVIDGAELVLAGDLNSARLFDSGAGNDNGRLFDNLAAQGYMDTRPRHQPSEVQTFFGRDTRPFQLDHVFSDPGTEARVRSWRVITEPVVELGLSDHAPIEIVVDAPTV